MPRPRKNLQSATKLKLERIVRLELLGLAPREIAADLGMRVASVRELTRHREYARVRERAVEGVYGPLDTELRRRASEMLETAAPDAALALIELLRSPDEVTRRQAATSILDRAGYGSVKRGAVRKSVDLDPGIAQLMREAMRESQLEETEDTCLGRPVGLTA